MNTHDNCRELISRLLDEDAALTPAEHESIQAHLAECPECAALYRAFSSLSGALGGELEEPPARLRENVMASLRREAIRRKNRRGFSRYGFIAVAAALALVIGLGPRILTRMDAQAPALTAQMASASVAAEEAVQEMRSFDAVSNEANAYADAAAAPAAEKALGADSGEAEEKISMDALLRCLSGSESELDPEELGLSAELLIDTDGGVMEIYRYGGGLYYRDPLTGIVCMADCSETELIDFLRG